MPDAGDVWLSSDPRSRRLVCLNKLLDGTFYDHLPYAFYEERDNSGKLIELAFRRPSVQYHLPRKVARWCSRKLWAGRHQPVVAHPDKAAARRILVLMHQCAFYDAMAEATYLGSVGSVAMMFRVSDDGRVSLDPIRSVNCNPVFDATGSLVLLRLNYQVKGSVLRSLGMDVDSSRPYWYIRDISATQEVTYHAPAVEEWTPNKGFMGDPSRQLAPHIVVPNEAGVLPAVWIKNLPGGAAPDGECTWFDAVPNSIEIDYLLSQASRGSRYNCAPQLVVRGQLVGAAGDDPEFGDMPQVSRSPVDYIHVRASYTGQQQAEGDGDAKLLEMTGAGVEAALSLVERLKDMAFDQIGMAIKDPERMKGPLSGRAMEYLDEDTHDLVMELRGAYGENGALPLLRKIVSVVEPGIDAGEISFVWPRLFQPTPDDIRSMIAAFAQGINPFGVPEPNPKFMLIDPKMAREIIASNLDVKMMGASADADVAASPDDGATAVADDAAGEVGSAASMQDKTPANTRLMVGDGIGSGAE